MEASKKRFRESLYNISTAKDKIFEISEVMLVNQTTAAKELVETWLEEFKNFTSYQKQLAMLFVMNDVLIKSVNGAGDQYLQAFSAIMHDIIHYLKDSKSENLLEELRKIVSVWEQPANAIFVQSYTMQLKHDIQEAIQLIRDENTGMNIIQDFEITQRLALLEKSHEDNMETGKHVEEIYENFLKGKSSWKVEEVKNRLLDYKKKCEEELVQRSKLLLELADDLQEQYEALNKI